MLSHFAYTIHGDSLIPLPKVKSQIEIMLEQGVISPVTAQELSQSSKQMAKKSMNLG